MKHILKQIQTERLAQDLKWGEQNHKPIEWCAILGEEVGEVNKAALESHFLKVFNDSDLQEKRRLLQDYKTELVQVAAVAVSMIECLERHNVRIGIKVIIWTMNININHKSETFT